MDKIDNPTEEQVKEIRQGLKEISEGKVVPLNTLEEGTPTGELIEKYKLTDEEYQQALKKTEQEWIWNKVGTNRGRIGAEDEAKLEAQILKVLSLQQEELEKVREDIGEIVIRVRQYLCNTEFAPKPFTEPVNADKLKGDFTNQILSLISQTLGMEK